jgi:hypothetical protein
MGVLPKGGRPMTARSETEQDLLRAILRKLVDIDDRFDEFARVILNAKFPHGKPDDRWGRRK